MSVHPDKPNQWKHDLIPYEKPILTFSVWQLVNTLLPFLLLWVLAYESLSISYVLTLALAVPAAGFLIRIFIIFHDCCHLSFFRSRRANVIIGTITGILTCVPYDQWRHTHSVHHATSSNLDKRGTGDVWTMTVEEYVAASFWKRLGYRLYRNPFVMFGLGPVFIFLIDYRFNRKKAGTKERMNTYVTNLGILGAAGLLCWLIGWQAFLMIQAPIFLMSGAAGIWLFYVQHQFENTYFENEGEWDYVKAALEGSSYYKLPKVLQWLTGNIGYHHIHHLSPRVPNYYLSKVHASVPVMQKVNTIGIVSSLRALRYRVWSEEQKMFLSLREIRHRLVRRPRTRRAAPLKP